jgi:hypothetical protein
MAGLIDQVAKNIGEDLKADFDEKLGGINKRFDKIEKNRTIL